jgi:hypothetical protein
MRFVRNIIFLLLIFLVGCTPAIVQPVRVVEKGKLEVGLGGTLSVVRVKTSYTESGYNSSIAVYPDLSARYGFENGFDFGIRPWGFPGGIMDVRWQFLGDRDSTFASSLDFELGYGIMPHVLLPAAGGVGITGVSVVSSVGIGGDMMVCDFLSVYLSSKFRFSFWPVYDYSQFISMPAVYQQGNDSIYSTITMGDGYSSYLYSVVSNRLTGLLIIGSLGAVILPKYNFSLVVEVSIGKSLKSDVMPLGFSIVPRIKF